METMTHDDRLKVHIELCRRMFERMQRDGSWPWKQGGDSQNAEDLLESGDDNK